MGESWGAMAAFANGMRKTSISVVRSGIFCVACAFATGLELNKCSTIDEISTLPRFLQKNNSQLFLLLLLLSFDDDGGRASCIRTEAARKVRLISGG